MVFEDVESIFIDNKEVQSIVVKDSGGILFEKREVEPLTFTFTGTTLTQYSNASFSGTNMIIDYGDGTIESTTGTFGHTYEGSGTYEVKIYGVISLGNSCFRNCTGLTSITIPSSVTSFGTSCFRDCTGLTSVTIPSSITSLRTYCFQGCTSLTSITIPSSVTKIEVSCFNGCISLTSINIPSSVTSIGTYCFQGCTSLTSITIPSSITSLGASCFRDCTGLTSVTIPSSITSFGNYCFQGCTSLISIQLNWTTASTILTYNSKWISNTSSTLKFHIPAGTTQLYIDKGYPLDKLIEESNVSEKIDTQFIEDKSELWLQDINGNYLEGKLITYQTCNNNTLTTFTKNTTFGGATFLSAWDIKCVVFEGDEEYNGCSYENSMFKGCSKK